MTKREPIWTAVSIKPGVVMHPDPDPAKEAAKLRRAGKMGAKARREKALERRLLGL